MCLCRGNAWLLKKQGYQAKLRPETVYSWRQVTQREAEAGCSNAAERTRISRSDCPRRSGFCMRVSSSVSRCCVWWRRATWAASPGVRRWWTLEGHRASTAKSTSPGQA